ncbi:MAG: PD40 domain-containing protein [Chloroflexi bacterium]|nr:PD40 domain-containing protein [Chloroflexota bacterium]
MTNPELISGDFIIRFRRLARALGLALCLAALTFTFLSADNSPRGTQILAPSENPAAIFPNGKLIFAAKNDGAWNLYADTLAQRIAPNSAPARDPAIAPDGKTIAFRSKRDGVWEIYALPLGGANPTRLTRGMIYSAAPAWSPDGKKIAFESYARGDLDIWVMNADGTQPQNLTDDSKAYESSPAWSPDGKWIAFTSWRTGAPQIFIVAADCVSAACRKPFNLSANKFGDQEPVFSPDGNKLAFVSERDGQRAIFVAEFVARGSSAPILQNARRITFSGWDDQPAWSPDGKWIAFVSPRATRQPIYIIALDGGIPRARDDENIFAASVAWSNDTRALTNDNANDAGKSLYTENPIAASPTSGHPYDTRRLTSFKVEPGINKLNSRVAESFLAFAARLKQEVGYDFLATLSDMLRPLELKCDNTCDTLSWHKAGRAIDTRLDYTDARGNSLLEIGREDQQGETYWRVFLRASAQDGTMGEPLKDAPWDLSYRARWVIAPGEGGTKKPLPYGFYVDVTELAREYGWTRISSADDADFNWKTDKIATEYWHFQKTQGLKWYAAISEVYAESEVKPIAEWNSLIRSGTEAYLLYLKAIPAPAKAWKWNLMK